MNICHEADVTDIRLVDLSKICVNPVPPGEEWRVEFLKDILSESELVLVSLLLTTSTCCSHLR